jgi:hypothetical protein
MKSARFEIVQAENWRKHLVEAVRRDPAYGCYSRVEQQEQEDGIVVHRADVRYCVLQATDANFHNGGHGGARNTCFQDYELDIVKDYVIYFFRQNPYATQADLADELSRVFHREVTIRVRILFYSILFYFILFYSILFYSILFYSILFYSVLFYSILFYSILFYSTFSLTLTSRSQIISSRST